jgi:hypothetical protein
MLDFVMKEKKLQQCEVICENLEATIVMTFLVRECYGSPKKHKNSLKFAPKNVKRMLKFANFKMKNEECHYYGSNMKGIEVREGQRPLLYPPHCCNSNYFYTKQFKYARSQKLCRVEL